MNIDYGINLMLSVVSMLYSVINIQMSVVRVEIFAYQIWHENNCSMKLSNCTSVNKVWVGMTTEYLETLDKEMILKIKFGIPKAS